MSPKAVSENIANVPQKGPGSCCLLCSFLQLQPVQHAHKKKTSVLSRVVLA